MKNLLLTLCLMFCNTHILLAQDFRFGKVSKDELEEKSHPLEQDATAAVLYREHKTNFDYSEEDGFYTVTEVFERIKIYKKEGFDWATKELGIYQSGDRKEEILNLKAYTYCIDGNNKIEEVKLKGDGIFDEKRSKYWKLKKFTMPNVKEGCIIEYKYKLKSPFKSNINTYRLQEEIPIKNAKIRFAAPEYYNYKTHQKGWLQFKIKQSQLSKDVKLISFERTQQQSAWDHVTSKSVTNTIRFKENIYIVNMENVPALKKEAYAGNIDNYSASLQFELSSTKFPNSPIKSYTTTWDAVSKTIYESDVFGGELKKENYFKDDIDNILSGVGDKAEKMMRIFEYAKSKMVWNSIGGIYTNEGVKNAYKKGKGNAAEINLMLTAMFRYAGLHANPILVSTKNHGIPIFPTKNGFNYVIAGVEVQDAVLLFDATTKKGEMNVLEPKLLNWKGRIIRKDGSSAWVDLVPKKHATKSAMIDVTISEDLSVRGTSKNRFSGHFNLEYRDVYENLNENDVQKKLEEEIENTELYNVKFENLKTLYKPITLNYDFDAFNTIEEIDGKLYFSPLLLWEHQKTSLN